MEEYKVWGRMTEKEVQLALLMKRVKERYITQEQALEMARVLRLEVKTIYFTINLLCFELRKIPQSQTSNFKVTI